MKANMKPMERMFSILDGLETDRPAAITPTSVATVENMNKTGASFPEAHTNAGKMAALAATGHSVLGFDSVAPYFSVLQEAAALGCEIDWGKQGTMPTASTHPYVCPDDFKLPKNFFDRLPIKTVIDAIRMLKDKYGDSVIVIGKVMGPWTLSYHLHGVQDFLIETITEPEMVRDFLEVFKEVSIKFALAQIEAGADVLTWADHATGDLISAKSYKEFLLPVHKRCTAELKSQIPRRVPVILHTCGSTLDRISFFTESGFDAFHFDSKNDPVKMLELAGNAIRLTGCVNNADILLNGTREDVVAQVNSILQSGIRMVSPECAIPAYVKNDNLRAITQTVQG